MLRKFGLRNSEFGGYGTSVGIIQSVSGKAVRLPTGALFTIHSNFLPQHPVGDDASASRCSIIKSYIITDKDTSDLPYSIIVLYFFCCVEQCFARSRLRDAEGVVPYRFTYRLLLYNSRAKPFRNIFRRKIYHSFRRNEYHFPQGKYHSQRSYEYHSQRRDAEGRRSKAPPGEDEALRMR